MSLASWRVLLLSSLGAGIEYYDFAIFALFSNAIEQAFFPAQVTSHGMLAVFMTFAVGYWVRPIGGYLIGYVADYYGRAFAFRMTMLLLGSSTIVMALLPSAAWLGGAATVLFVILRCIQGAAVGGEIPTALTYVIEQMPQAKGQAVGVIFAALSLGILLTTGVFHLLNQWQLSQGLDAWRMAFIMGAIWTFVIYGLRFWLTEKPVVITANPNIKGQDSTCYGLKQILASIGLMSIVAMATTQFFIILPNWANQYASHVSVSQWLPIAALIMLPCCLIGGWLSDVLNRSVLFMIWTVLLVSAGGIVYLGLLLEIQKWWIGLLIAGVALGGVASTYPVIIAETAFPKFRGRLLGLSYNMSYSLFSAPVPLLMGQWFFTSFGQAYAPMILLIGTGMTSLLGIWWFSKQSVVGPAGLEPATNGL